MDEEFKPFRPAKPSGLEDIDKLQEQALNELKQDAEVYAVIHDELKLSRAETKAALVELFALQEDCRYCAACPGYEECAKGIPHHRIKLVRDGDLVKRTFISCPLAKEIEEYRAHFLVRDFPDEWANEGLKKSVERTGKKKEFLRAAIETLKGKSKRWLFVRGGLNDGRTFALACLANDMVRTNNDYVVFADTTSFFDKLKGLSINAKKDFETLFKQYIAAPLLVLDDFGNEPKSSNDYTYANIVYPLLNERAKAGRVTCFSSDFTIEEIASMYAKSIGVPRARQLQNLLSHLCGAEFDLSGLKVH